MDKSSDENSLDFELMHSQLVKGKKGYKAELQSVLISSTSLELSVNSLLDLKIKKLESKSLEDWAKNPAIPISAKVRLLRVSEIISEELSESMRILFNIRNQFAHKFWPTPETRKEVYRDLERIDIGSDFVSKLPNDVVKFQLVSSHCFKELFDVSEKVDPQSVKKLVLDSEFTVIDEEET